MKNPISFIGIAAAAAACMAAFLGSGWSALPLAALWLAGAFFLGWLIFRKLPPLSDRSNLLAAGILCVSLRVLSLVLFPVDTAPIHDFGTYFRLASFLAGDGPLPQTSANLFPHILFFSMALSVPFRIFGSSILNYQLCGIVLSLLSMSLLYGILRGFSGRRTAFYGALLWALSPVLILYAPLNCSEHLALTLMLLYLYLLFRMERRSVRSLPQLFVDSAVLGLLLLVLELVRPIAIILLIATLLYLPIRHRKALCGHPLPAGGAVLTAVLILYGGKMLALQAADGILPQPLSTSSYTFTLLAGSNPESSGSWNEADSKLFLDTLHETYSNGYDYQSAYTKLNAVTRERYRKMSASGLCKLLLHKNEMLWGQQRVVVSSLVQYQDTARSPMLYAHPRILSLAGHFCDAGTAVLLLLMAVGCYREIRRKHATPQLWNITATLGFVCLYCISEASGRYTVVVLPLLYCIAAPVIADFFKREDSQKHE